jgi:hypothetical protein
MRWTGNAARMGEMRNIWKIFVGKPEGNRPLGTPRRGWECNMRMDRREIEWEIVDWILLAQNRKKWRAFVNMIMNLHFP